MKNKKVIFVFLILFLIYYLFGVIGLLTVRRRRSQIPASEGDVFLPDPMGGRGNIAHAFRKATYFELLMETDMKFWMVEATTWPLQIKDFIEL